MAATRRIAAFHGLIPPARLDQIDAEIRRLLRVEGMPIKVIMRGLEIARNTVRMALLQVSSADPAPAVLAEEQGLDCGRGLQHIRKYAARQPEMPTTVIAGRIGSV